MSPWGQIWGVQGSLPPLQLALLRLSKIFAALGGAIIFAASLTVTLSVVMRATGIGGIRGDFELVELVSAACASLFLPLCQLRRGHVLVDLFTNWLPFGLRQRLDGVWTLLFALGWALLCWRLMQGLVDLHGYGDRTMLLGVPIWWVYVPAVLSTGLSALIALVTARSLLRGTAPQMEQF
jgi:TRAP-type C4-dicarboxylate transport system permease small subunit